MPADDVISPQRMDQIVDAISLAEWEQFRDYPDVVIGRMNADEPFRILGGFASGEALADLVLSLPKTASCFVAWHRDRLPSSK
jgi:hypothetical protein